MRCLGGSIAFNRWRNLCSGCVAILLLLALVSVAAWGQHGSEGRISVTVMEPTGSVVQGAQLELQDLATNEARKAETGEKGAHTFVNLSIGAYKLTVSKPGFKTQVFDSIVVESSK